VNTNIPGTTIANPLNGGTVGTPYAPSRIRASIYTKDGYKSAVAVPTTPTGVAPTTTNKTIEFLLPNVSTALPLTGNEILLQDKYGNTTPLRVQTSNSTSSNYKSSSILLDRKDMQALVGLANQSRRVKTYTYTGSAGVVTKLAGQYDFIDINSAVSRTYNKINAAGGSGFIGGSGKLLVTPGGYVENNFGYTNVINYLLAEYGSLGEDQRKVGYVQNAATKFVRNLAAYTTNKNYVADKNAFTFSHDAQLNFNTSFTGKDLLNFRIRGNNTFGFAGRAANPASALAYDGSTTAWPKAAKSKIYIDKMFYRFPVGNYARAAVGTRLPQAAILPTRGSYYTKEALLEFFNSSAGVFPSYTGTGVGLSLGKLGGKGALGMKGVSFGIAYLANESDAVAPDSSNTISQGWFGADTRFRLPVQLAWQSKNKKWLASANYAYERGNNSMGQVGTQLALTPFMYASLNESNQFGFTLAYQWSKDFSLTGAYGHAAVNARYDNSVLGVKMADAGDSAVMNSWMLAANFKNVFLKGNSAGIAIGGVPSVVSNSSGWNKDGGMPTAIETWYQFQVTDNISITPGIFYISSNTNSDGIGGGDIWGGVIKTQFKF
ncbi:MAG: iron uptake porin, partial [Cyanobacteria bacterium]|nr:iron uptake porin [Cyanobacteriota bacterium]